MGLILWRAVFSKNDRVRVAAVAAVAVAAAAAAVVGIAESLYSKASAVAYVKTDSDSFDTRSLSVVVVELASVVDVGYSLNT